MKRLIFLASGLWVLCSSAYALTDTNSNGLSDDWEKTFNGGQLFSAMNPDHAPTADPDLDGWTNLKEATAGTSPFQSLPPAGILAPTIAVTPATYEPLPEGSAPPPSSPPPDPMSPPPPSAPDAPRILLDPAEIRLTWPTVPGKTYQAFLTPDLLAWSPASGAYVGSGTPITYETAPLNEDGTIPEKLFWRVETGDTDSDGDTINDYEEILRGLVPLSIDSDGDGLPDNTDPAPLVNSLQAVWDADSTDPSGASFFAAFNFTPPTIGGYPFTAGRVTDISGNDRHGKARTQPGFSPPPQNPPQENAEGIANQGFHCANTHHFAFDLKNPGINFAPVSSLSFWLKTKSSDLEVNGQPVFSYAPRTAAFAQSGNTSNPYAARAFVRKQISGTGYEVVWLDWTFPGNIVRERWTLDLTAAQLDAGWFNLSFVWQGTGSGQDKLWACYANGVKQNRTLGSVLRFQTTPTTPNTPQDTFLIGADAAGGSGQNNLATVQSTFKGTMDRVRIYTVALNQTQVDSIVKQDADNDGLWDSTEANATAWKDTNSNGKRDMGEIRYPNGSPLLWQPANTDSDTDDLIDIDEQNLTKTDPYNHDSDNDLLPDGWEHINFLNPLSSVGNDGQTGDPDGDGLDNFDEWRFLSRPKAAPGQPNSTATDSDGDGVPDGIESGQGSHPADPGDTGHAPAATDKLTLRIILGDPSSSNSERWRIEAEDIATGATILRHASRQYGQMSTATASTFDQFKPGKAYRFKLRHAGTDPAKLASDPDGISYPDYDWSLQISYQDEQGNFINLSAPTQNKYLVIDPYNSTTKAIITTIPNLLATEAAYATIGVGSAATLKYRYDMQPSCVVMLPLTITPDANRDGKIDLADHGKVTATKPWRFWTNDDDDSGSTEGNDLPQTPGSEYTNGYDHKVNGVRDLIDFFPLDLDLKAALETFPQGKYRYRISHAASQNAPCLKIAQARNQSALTAGHYLKDVATATATGGLECQPIHSVGRSLDTRFLDAQEQGDGILLVEAVRPTTAPIKLSIIRKSDQVLMGEVSFPVSITSVNDMYRWKFLEEGTDGGTQGGVPGSPPNWPDVDRNGKHFVFVHGYNVSAEGSRGWNGEIFKKLFWSESNAMYTGISWRGNESQFFFTNLSPDYWRNVRNAFATSESLADFVTALPGEEGKVISAHSLGNMVVSSAIKDHGLEVDKYYLIDAAVPAEAYDEGQINKDEMSHPDWRDYDEDLWATEWHLGFPETDNRRTKMTWRGRFGVLENAHNFYSTGEEILLNSAGTVPFPGTKRSWAYQELSKGRSFITGGGILHDGNGGLVFGNHWDVLEGEDTFRRRTPSEAEGIDRNQLDEHPFFLPFANDKFHDPSLGSAEALKYNEVARALAEALPALSFATGANYVGAFGDLQNTDLNAPENRVNGWPSIRASDDDELLQGWLHSDIRDVAYLYTYFPFDNFVTLGGLKND